MTTRACNFWQTKPTKTLQRRLVYSGVRFKSAQDNIDLKCTEVHAQAEICLYLTSIEAVNTFLELKNLQPASQLTTSEWLAICWRSKITRVSRMCTS